MIKECGGGPGECDGCTFISVSLLRRMGVDLRVRLDRKQSQSKVQPKNEKVDARHDFACAFHVHFSKTAPDAR
jgi:hypothetical protein